MPTDPMEFADRVGQELAQHLGARSRAELLGLSQQDQFSAAIGASLICVAEVLRIPVEKGVPAERVIEICGRQLHGLLADVRPPEGGARFG
jgi:hypothetical protein